ncbi:ankyrin repeat-containing domain protein [Lactarius akahatsu]|uniref:Ankyrin repeat-containing domain protein n=1 Tax=Lactarius akahatsu TaxID=416441 RepID=A0AAD4Q7F9_9AGAM|nr:ankyrin repeat-containing domain protein [Lactarius akahatsu]
MLVDRGANVNAEDNRGRTPLHRALEDRYQSDKDFFAVAQLLMERGADVDARDKDDETPLHLSSYIPEVELLRMLLDLGANVNAADEGGRPSLHRVLDPEAYLDKFGFGIAEAAKLLVERGADVNTREEDHGETPLHLASRLMSLDVVWTLLEHGADLNAENNEGKIPFQLVQESMRKEMDRPPLKYFFPQAEVPEWRARAQGVALMGRLYGYQYQAVDSPEAILTVLEGKADELNQSRSSDERLTKWLKPTVNIINTLSATLGEGAALVFPPTKIIFSGIGILLVAAKSTVASREVLVELFDRIESFFQRLRIYTTVPRSPAVTDELAKILAEVLSILGIATKGIKERQISGCIFPDVLLLAQVRPEIFLKNVAGMNDLEDSLQRIGELERRELLTGIAQVTSDTSVLKDDTKEIKADAKEAKTMVKEIAEKMDARDLDEVLQKLKRWLSPPDPSTNYNIGLRDLHKETATWFLEGRIFQEWYSMGSLLWIHGKPGSGKSILCSTIIQRLISLCDDGRASVAYFYFDFRDDKKKHLHDLLPSLLVQFAAQSIPCCDIISRVYSTHGKGMQTPSDEVLINCLVNILSTVTQHPIYIIVDALDECLNTSGVRSPRERVLGLMKHLINLHLPNLHICVTSRPEIDIRIRLEPLTSRRVSLHDQTGHREDIAKYINSEVGVVANDNTWREDDKELVIETLSQKADGMFRWVYCQLEMLRLCLRSRVRQFVNELPDSLDDTYARVLKGIPRTNRSHVQRLLQFLTVARRPPRVDVVAAVFAFDVDAIEGEVLTLDANSRSEDQEQELLSACPSLITIFDSHNSRVVQFSHFSVKEFLVSDRLAVSSEDTSRYHILPEDAHTALAQAFLGVLLRLDDRADSPNASNIPLAEYAAEHWVSHAQVGSVSSRVMDKMKILFDSDKPHFAAWVRIYDLDNQPFLGLHSEIRYEMGNCLYYSALCGFYDLVEHLVKRHPQHVNAIGGTHGHPIAAALDQGHLRIAELLLRHGANVDGPGRDGRTPLHQAIEWSSDLTVGAVRFLLENGADANARRTDLSTPLHLAAGGCDGVLIFNFKVSSGAFTASFKSKADCLNLVQLLLEYGALADVNSRNAEGSTPLHNASHVIDVEVARVLLDNGACVNAEDSQGQTPLHRMLLGSRIYNSEDSFDVAQLLTERGADVNAQEEVHGETPLHLASRLMSLEVVWILLKHGADRNAENNEGKIPFQLVQESMREEMEWPNAQERPPGPLKFLFPRADIREWRARVRAQGVALMGLFYGY